jgi:hypothetical protein
VTQDTYRVKPHELAGKIAEVIRLVADTELTAKIKKEFKKRAPQVIRDDFAENYAGSKDPDDKPWMPLKHPRPSGRGGPVLVEYGRGRDAATKPHSRYSKVVVTDNSVEFEVSHPHVMFHDEDVTIRPKGKGKNLAIPITREAAHRKPREFGRPLTVMFRGRRAVGLMTGGRRGKLQYVFAKQVRRVARVVVGIGDRLSTKLADLLEEIVDQGFGE